MQFDDLNAQNSALAAALEGENEIVGQVLRAGIKWVWFVHFTIETNFVNKNRGWKSAEIQHFRISLQGFKAQVLSGIAQFAFQFEIILWGFWVCSGASQCESCSQFNNFNLKLEVK